MVIEESTIVITYPASQQNIYLIQLERGSRSGAIQPDADLEEMELMINEAVQR